ncbi:MAG TPA: hypothetical protein VFZ66_10135, partial [Herpetosiphonaceae bacterium]
MSSSDDRARPASDTGWVRFVLPDGWQDVGVWRVRIGETTGQPGERIAAPVGCVRVIVEAAVAMLGFQGEGTLAIDVEVQPDGLTEMTLPLTV